MSHVVELQPSMPVWGPISAKRATRWDARSSDIRVAGWHRCWTRPNEWRGYFEVVVCKRCPDQSPLCEECFLILPVPLVVEYWEDEVRRVHLNLQRVIHRCFCSSVLVFVGLRILISGERFSLVRDVRTHMGEIDIKQLSFTRWFVQSLDYRVF